jgi:hypothetical protein
MQTMIIEINIDTELLRQQRNYLLTMEDNDHIRGLVNLLDALLDELETNEL